MSVKSRPTTEQDALLAGVLANPDDDLPRLVFADCLEEGGEGERAEFIRVQCELAALEPKHDAECRAVCCQRAHDDCPVAVLRQRERELWAGVRRNYYWWSDPPPDFAITSAVNETEFALWQGGVAVGGASIRRGFVSKVRAPLAALVGGPCQRCGGVGEVDVYEGALPDAPCPRCRGAGRTPGCLPEVVRREPVEFVVATDRHPVSFGSPPAVWYGWVRPSPGLTALTSGAVVPDEVWDLLDGYTGRHDDVYARWYDSETAARDALSRAILAFARSTTGTGRPLIEVP